MRVTDRMVSQNLLTYLGRNKSSIQELQSKIASNQKILKPSDSPTGMSIVLNLQSTMKQNASFKTNIDNSVSFLQTTLDTMESMQTEVENVIVKFSEMKNVTNKEFYSTYGDQIQSALESLIEMSGTEFDGKYIFGGTDYSDKPYAFNSDQSAVVQQVASTEGTQNVRIRKNTVIKVNVAGNDLFGAIDGSDIFNSLLTIKDKLKNGEGPSDEDIKNVKDFNLYLLNSISAAGNRMNRLEDAKTQLNSQDLVVQGLMSQENEIDLADAIMQLQTQQYALDVSYQLASKINQRSLMDYL